MLPNTKCDNCDKLANTWVIVTTLATSEAGKSTMENISGVQQSAHSSLYSLCQWIVHTHSQKLQQLCEQGPSNLTQYAYQPDTRSITHRYNSLYGDAIQHSFTAGSGIIGTLGCVLLVLVVIAFISCVREHRRIQVNKQIR